MNLEQIKLARHALGLPNIMNRSYRNRFVCSDLHNDYFQWINMVLHGNVMLTGTDLFSLTRQGALQALKNGETLDPEDFPDIEGIV